LRIWTALPLRVLSLACDGSPNHHDNRHDSKEDKPFDNDKTSYDLRRHHHCYNCRNHNHWRYHNKGLLWLAMHNRRKLPSWHRVHYFQVRNEEVHTVGAPRRFVLQNFLRTL
jgi:hypothetical protein